MVVVRLECGFAQAGIRRGAGAVAAVRVGSGRDNVGRRVGRERHIETQIVLRWLRSERLFRLLKRCQIVNEIGQSAEQHVRVDRVVFHLQC